jgi:cell division protease FtsH
MDLKRPSWLMHWRQRLRRTWDRFRGASGGEKALGIAAVLATGVVAVLLGLALNQTWQNHRLDQTARQGVLLTGGAVEQAIVQRHLSAVTWYAVGDLSAPVSIYSLRFDDGSQGWVESTWLPEKVKSDLAITAVSDNVHFQTGGAIQSAEPYWNALGVMGFLLGMAVIFAGVQLAMTQQDPGFEFLPVGANRAVTFDSIVGYEGPKREIQEVLDQLQETEHWAHHDVKAPTGLLLVGPPGVGKTLFGKAMANQAGMAFLSLTGSNFAQMFVGVGAGRVRRLFTMARRAQRCIIFIDEMDAIGSREHMHHDTERRSVINQFLAELDGINESGRVLVIGATNHPENLDPALLRSGRFGKKIAIDLPDWATRQAMLERHLAALPVATLDVPALTGRATGMSGADIKTWVDDAKKLALRDTRPGTPLLLTQEHFRQAHEILLMGTTENLPQGNERLRVAHHEMGHALVGHLCCPHRVIDTITVRGRGSALGFTLHRPLDDRQLHTREEMEGTLAFLMGGREAEILFCGSPSDGAAGDLREANRLAQRMVMTLGMGPRLGLVGWVADQASLGEAMNARALEDVRELLDQASTRARALLHTHKNWLQKTSERLAQEGTLRGPEVLGTLPKPDQDTVTSQS